ncbi:MULTISPECIES: CD225/dispanin family protein [Xanthomonas]|uniref:CD225/dispanin family protein n=1 Tax=Xanthomonas rydalmerensis TaxID=3046274 RepID=A0ABZ0JNN2_9XANT|nr:MULTISPECIES: CD225/dispanin family protein [unclassified Xanthomonas]MBB5878279.1 putative secreted protein [Xanthomonas sp. 3498]MBB5941980.1 putative secreted protein [Xanthomonas sp. 3307]MXV06770.1 CD225/dispanin family protein [Xanthomonas sp. LMG 9002]WOS40589.1 CD225/dispanin family protein [Xanthomonas sp. DM-2023]WOS44773.1 CD225/dispanin family protein [Xanthomonas sp. DM-2023]
MNTTAPQVSNNLVWAILTTLFCCLPLGIVSIVYAAQVNTKLAAGDVTGARDSADKAKKWAIYSAITAVVLMVLYMIFLFALGGLGMMQQASAS